MNLTGLREIIPFVTAVAAILGALRQSSRLYSRRSRIDERAQKIGR